MYIINLYLRFKTKSSYITREFFTMDRNLHTGKRSYVIKGTEPEFAELEHSEEHNEEDPLLDEEESSIDQVEDPELRCSICKQIFYDPKTLICQHTYCSACIVKSIPEQSDIIPWLKCVICWKESLVPSSINTTLRNIIEEKYPELSKKRKEKQEREEIKSSLKEQVLKEFQAEFLKNLGRNVNDLESVPNSGHREVVRTQRRGYQVARTPRMFENVWRTPNYNGSVDAMEYNNVKTKEGNHRIIVFLKRFIIIAPTILHIIGIFIGIMAWKYFGTDMGMLIILFFILSSLIVVARKEHDNLTLNQDMEYGMY